ncbi:MAG: type IV pilus assembly protein PilM [Pirellulaceae bacterium]
MISLFSKKRVSPIGVDLGTRSVKLCQLSADHGRLVDAARWELPVVADGEDSTEEPRPDDVIDALRQAREGRAFLGRDAVLCLNCRQLFLQNIRLPKTAPDELERAVHQEAAARVPYPMEEAEIRYVEAADIRHGDQIVREIIVMACHRPVLEQALGLIERAGLCPVAVDVEPAALARSFANQSRREEDREQRSMLVHIGGNSTAVVIVQGEQVLFVKYIPLGGRQFDGAVARSLKMSVPEAATLRRHDGDRRSDRQDSEIARSVTEAVRPVVARLAAEIAMCVRYHSVTFRGQPLARLVLGGGEATPQLMEALQRKLGVTCELSDPFRSLSNGTARGHVGQWDVAAGLASRTLN